MSVSIEWRNGRGSGLVSSGWEHQTSFEIATQREKPNVLSTLVNTRLATLEQTSVDEENENFARRPISERIPFNPWNQPSAHTHMSALVERFVCCVSLENEVRHRRSIHRATRSNLNCVSGNCSSWSTINRKTYCTDHSVNGIVSSEERYVIRTITVGIPFNIGYVSSAWFANLDIGGWNIINRIRTIVWPDGLLNSSPVAITLPVIRKAINVSHVHVVQMADFDGNDVLKCRWSVSSTAHCNGYDERSNVCSSVTGALVYQDNCTLVFTLNQSGVNAAVILQIEDYYSSLSSTTMSLVPLQWNFYTFPRCNDQYDRTVTGVWVGTRSS